MYESTRTLHTLHTLRTLRTVHPMKESLHPFLMYKINTLTCEMGGVVSKNMLADFRGYSFKNKMLLKPFRAIM